MTVLEYDHVEIWGFWIRAILAEIMPKGLLDEMKNHKVQFNEDALDFLSKRFAFSKLAAHVMSRCSSWNVRVYHGTRLTDTEITLVRNQGLKPLLFEERKILWVAILKGHPKWNEYSEEKLDETIRSKYIKIRQDDHVHVCFSRRGLLHGCNHYLTHGAEVDGNIAYFVLGDTADEIFQKNRRPFLISFQVPLIDAIDAAKGTGASGDDQFGFLKHMLRHWAQWEVRPDLSTTSIPDDSAARFAGNIEASRIENIEEIDDADLWVWKP